MVLKFGSLLEALFKNFKLEQNTILVSFTVKFFEFAECIL
jgi:hypothetical protein